MNIIETKLTFGSNHSNRKGKVTGIVLHHAAAKSASVETVHDWHRTSNGWAGIGYHFYVRKDGKVYRGRPENWMGAHTTGHNEKIGICAEGDFGKETMTAAQQAAIVDLLRYLFGKYGKVKVYKHRDLDNTACPGANYPFDAIVKAANEPKKAETPKPAPKKNLVLDFQKAAIADGVSCGAAGADGIWGLNTAKAAKDYPLKKGSTGNRVKLLQHLLVDRGYNLGTTGTSKNGVDGDFGAKTHAAVRAYQSKKGLAVDGIVGLNTWKALLGV